MISINSRGTENLVSGYTINQINDDVLLIGTDQTSETLDEKAALCRSLAGIFSHTQALHLAIYKLDQGDSTAASYGEWREEEGGLFQECQETCVSVSCFLWSTSKISRNF